MTNKFPMEKLFSRLSYYYKYMFPVLNSIIAIGTLIYFIQKEFWIPTIITFFAFVTLIGVYKNFYFDLKYVYLDQTNNQIIIKEKNKLMAIDLKNIESVEEVKILSRIVIVNLKVEIYNFNSFSFVPKKQLLYKQSISEKLNTIIRNQENSKE
jgi:hypothetical protein